VELKSSRNPWEEFENIENFEKEKLGPWDLAASAQDLDNTPPAQRES
jgi:hypothetical protein